MKKNGFTAIRESEAPAACHSPGDPEILYVQAVEEFGAALARLARGYEAAPDRRKELLQDIHAELWHSFVRFDGRCLLRTWVYQVAHNTRLKPLDREVILLYLEDWSADEIAQVSGISPVHVAVKVHRIKQLLTRLFQAGVFGGSIAATFCWSLWMSRRDAKQIEQELAALESLRGT